MLNKAKETFETLDWLVFHLNVLLTANSDEPQRFIREEWAEVERLTVMAQSQLNEFSELLKNRQ